MGEGEAVQTGRHRRTGLRTGRGKPAGWRGRSPPATCAAVTCTVLAGCVSIGTVRPAEVTSGRSVAAQVELVGPPGEAAAWMWSLYCAHDCNRRLPGGEIGYTVGHVPRDGAGKPWALGMGLAGLLRPYGDLYVQLGEGSTPWGLGGRLGVPWAAAWFHSRLYGRVDLELEDGGRILLNPAVLFETGRSPNGRSRGRFGALVLGVGYLAQGEGVSWIPAASLAVGRGVRERDRAFADEDGPSTAVFGTLSLALVLHRKGG